MTWLGAISILPLVLGCGLDVRAPSFEARPFSPEIVLSEGSPPLRVERAVSIGGRRSDIPIHILHSPEGGFLLYGSTRSISALPDVLIVRTGPDLELEWARVVGRLGSDELHACAQTSDGGTLLAATIDRELEKAAHFATPWEKAPRRSLIAKLDAMGAVVWSRRMNLAPITALAETIDGGCLAIGSDEVISLVKLDKVGALEWSKSFRSKERLAADSVATVDGKRFLIAGKRWRSPSLLDLVVLTIDSAGKLEACSVLEGPNLRFTCHVVARPDGFAVAGTCTSGGEDHDPFLVMFDASGEVRGAVLYPDSTDDVVTQLIAARNGRFLLLGASDGNASYLETDSSGVPRRHLRFGGPSNDMALAGLEVDRGLVVAGATSSYGAGGADIFLVRLDAGAPVPNRRADPKTAVSDLALTVHELAVDRVETVGVEVIPIEIAPRRVPHQ